LIIQIDTRCSVPIYKQLKTAIIRGILSGELKEGERLPSVRQLGCDLGINLHTVNKVYTLLSDEGYIKILRGMGAVVACAPEGSQQNMEDFARLLLPIIMEMRAKNMKKAQFMKLVDSVWEECATGTGDA
jgi:GntR family transcriptional regulator